jgi:glycosyltransferase involved in cell wall biosynthesis
MTMPANIVIIINNLGIGGAERLVVGDVNEMLKIGINVRLITLKPESKSSFIGSLNLEKEKFHCVPFPNLFDIKSWLKLVQIIKSTEPDLVVTHLWFANTIGRIAARIAGVKSIISFEQNVYDDIKTKKMFFVDWCLQFLSMKIIAVSNAVKKSLIKHGIKESRIDVLYNSIDLKVFETTDKIGEIRKEFNIPEDSFLYIFVGRLIHQKAVDILLDSFIATDSDAYLLIVGKGPDREELELKVSSSGLKEKIIFTGVRNDTSSLLLSADCFILPSRYEGLPLVLIEALAAGLPIIVSDFEASKEVIIHEKNGLIVPREDVKALALGMTRIKEDGELRARLALEAKITATRFSISNHVRDILRYIKSSHI